MYLLYSQIFCLLLIALVLLAIPIAKEKIKLHNSMIILAIATCSFTIFIYHLIGNPWGLYKWINGGREHYFLLMQFDKLGGVEGIIKKIQTKLAKNPNDAEGWNILGKLYQSQDNIVEAQKAFAKANLLKAKM